MRRKAIIRFEDEKLKDEFFKLKETDIKFFNQLDNTFDNIEENAFCSIQIKKRLFPKKWKHYSNLWKYNLPNAWRLIYTIAPPDKEGKVIVLVIILDWMNHKDYEKLFGY
ncbi:MAG: hypothetical protein ABII01_05200 [Candidatus Woesearchaeota archaeon]